MFTYITKMYILLSLAEQSNGMIHNIVKSSKDPCAPLKTKDNCKQDVDNICVWCKSGAVPDSCIPLEKAKTLPPAIFFCDFPDGTTSTASNDFALNAADGSETKKCVSINVKGSVQGQIIAELDSIGAPITVKNFLSYVEQNYFSGTIFHRVISNFMIQCGGFTADFYTGNAEEKAGALPPIKNEASTERPNLKGTLSMARTSKSTCFCFIPCRHVSMY